MTDEMTDAELKRIINEVLSKELQAFGFSGADFAVVVAADGSVFLDVESHVERRVDPVVSIKTRSRLRQALLAVGEERFPVVINHHPEAA